MTRHALSERVKKIKKRNGSRQAMIDAINAYKVDEKRERKDREGGPAIAKRFNVAYRTMMNHVRQKSKGFLQEANAKKRKLLEAEERVLVEFIVESADRGMPLSHSHIKKYANALIQARMGPDYEPVGHQWVFNFLNRWHHELQTHWSKSLDMQRGASLNPEAVKGWFDLVEKFVVQAGILPENLYAMDESGFPPGYQGKTRVIGRRGTKTQHKQGGADRENVTSLVTICADGTSIPPMIIYKGQNFMTKWGENNVANAAISHSPNGWTDGEHAREWIEKVFNQHTEAKADNKPRVLLLDGHSSHYTLEVITYAKEHNIILLAYPPHCTHALQGLDVACFAKMKMIWKEEISEFEELNQRQVTKSDFTGVFGRAYLRAFDAETVKAAFSATGIHPFNREVITPQQMMPSTPHSISGGFPNAQPSPVRAIIAASRAHPPTTFDVEEDTHTPSEGPPETPSRRRRRVLDPEIDPELCTPSKRMRLMHSALASTSSGSLLVSKAKLTSENARQLISNPILDSLPQLLQPDWDLMSDDATEHLLKEDLIKKCDQLVESLCRAYDIMVAQQVIIEGANAQLVIQHMTLDKLNQSLHLKENRKKDDRTTLFNGSSVVLTSDEFVEAVRALREKRRQLLAQKKKNAEARAQKKDLKAAMEARWEEMKKDHEIAVEAWLDECRGLELQKVPKKDWPKKPTRPLRRDVEAEFAEEEDIMPDVVDDDEMAIDEAE